MARAKYDGIVQAVRYGEDGEILWVRAFLRRGPTWSDRVLIDRKTLVDKLKSGKQFVIGKRVELMASTFETSSLLRLVTKNGHEILVAGEPGGGKDCLEGAPLV
jgi:hypothetical protein